MPLFHWIPLWISFRSINKKIYRRTPEYMSDWQKHFAPRVPIRTVMTQFSNNSSLWTLKPFRVLVNPVYLAPRRWTSEKPWPFVSHGDLSWVISHLFSFHWFQFERYRRMQPLMCNSAHIEKNFIGIQGSVFMFWQTWSDNIVWSDASFICFSAFEFQLQDTIKWACFLYIVFRNSGCLVWVF